MQGNVKVLLVKRKNEPYKDQWALVGGALYNNETLLEGAKREIFEKTGIDDINIYFANLADRVDRSPLLRMISVNYIGIIDAEKVNILSDTINTSNADWFSLSEIPKLAYDHNEILDSSLECLKQKILETDILKGLFPSLFGMPELQKVFETILNKKFDRRNFRKKILNLNIVEKVDETRNFEGKKPANMYRFKKNVKNQNVF